MDWIFDKYDGRQLVCSDQRESHIVTKKFEVKQLETNDDDNVDFNRTVSVSEVRWIVNL